MKKVLMMLDNEFEDSEALQPLTTLQRAGVEVTVAAPEANKIYRGKKNKATITSHIALEDVQPDQFDILVIPGGNAPDHLRIRPAALGLAKSFAEAVKPIAAICHGPQVLISARLLQNRTLTCYQSIIVDVENAGGKFLDEALVVDDNLITSRTPDDLPQFCQALLALAKGEKVHSTV